LLFAKEIKQLHTLGYNYVMLKLIVNVVKFNSCHLRAVIAKRVLIFKEI